MTLSQSDTVMTDSSSTNTVAFGVSEESAVANELLAAAGLHTSAADGRSHPAKMSIELGPYVVQDVMENDKTGHVFRAHHGESNRPVAIKVLPPLRSQRGKSEWSHDRMDKFSQEIATASELIHDNIARPNHVGEQDDVQYVAMEFVDGISLQKMIERDSTMDVPVATEIILQAASGLRYIHEKGLVHRDIRPSNIVLSRDGNIKIMELGVGQLKVTDTQECLGDTAYLAPELVRDGRADIRSDIYALGCTAYKLLSGESPNGASDIAMSLQQLRPEITPQLGETIQRMMAEDPEDRYQSPKDVVIEMCNWAQQERMHDLVAWHMNTQNAGLAPAVIFQGVERRRRQDEKARRQIERVGKRKSLRGKLSDPIPNLNVEPHDEKPGYLGLVAILSSVAIAIGVCAFLGGRASVQQSSPALLQNAPAAALAGPHTHTVHTTYHEQLLHQLATEYQLPKGEWALPAHENEPLFSATYYGATKEPISISGHEFQRAFELSVPNAGAAAWDAGYYFADVNDIRRGDRLLFVAWLRKTPESSSADSQAGKVAFFVEDASTDEKDIYIDLEPTETWQQFLIPFESKSHALRRIGFHLGLEKQKIQVGGIGLINYQKNVPLTSLPMNF